MHYLLSFLYLSLVGLALAGKGETSCTSTTTKILPVISQTSTGPTTAWSANGALGEVIPTSPTDASPGSVGPGSQPIPSQGGAGSASSPGSNSGYTSPSETNIAGQPGASVSTGPGPVQTVGSSSATRNSFISMAQASALLSGVWIAILAM